MVPNKQKKKENMCY